MNANELARREFRVYPGVMAAQVTDTGYAYSEQTTLPGPGTEAPRPAALRHGRLFRSSVERSACRAAT